MIEDDRNYARKFVISENELYSIISPKPVAQQDDISKENILSIWTDILTKSGLDNVIFNEDTLPDRLRFIEESWSEQNISLKKTRRKPHAKTPPFISTLKLDRFREFPVQHVFEFGKVNLIYGPNASGKTSLLEAIELFYCGRNKRNPKSPSSYEISLTYVDGINEKADCWRDLQLFRDRNLIWYGQSEIKTTNLYQSFARYNFLDTDAAVSLSTDEYSEERFNEDLSRLLVGPDASKTWTDIKRVNEAVSNRLQETTRYFKLMDDELTELHTQIKNIDNVAQESDSISVRLDEMLNRAGWVNPKKDSEEFLSKLLGDLSELMSLLNQITKFNIPNWPLSIDELRRYCATTKTVIENTGCDILSLESLQQTQTYFTDYVEKYRESLELALQARKLIDLGLPKLNNDREEEENRLERYSAWLSNAEENTINEIVTSNIVSSVKEFEHDAILKLVELEGKLEKANDEYQRFCGLREESINLAQELRQTAGKILQNSKNYNECPLCHTMFGPGELLKHILIDINEQTELEAQSIISQLRDLETEVNEAKIMRHGSTWLINFCGLTDISPNLPINKVIAEVKKVRYLQTESQKRLEVLNRDLAMLETQGFTQAKLDAISTRLSTSDYPLSKMTKENADFIIMEIKRDLEDYLRKIETDKKQVNELQPRIANELGLANYNLDALKERHWQLKDRIETIELLISNIETFSDLYPWLKEKPITEILVQMESIRKIASDLQSALEKEKLADTFYQESTMKENVLNEEINKLKSKIKHLEKAQSVLKNIIAQHSLEAAMESTIQKNREVIENIFMHIHSPVEFSKIGSSIRTLIRKGDGKESDLKEISTGQRTAFALSIFLAQNSQLTTAPPIILIDDPIAHIDDLNALSFLDYLREITLNGNRQIFFTTANERLASLFERKFDFLGSENFKRINLTRD